MKRKFASFTISMVFVFTMFISVDMGFEVGYGVRATTLYVGGVSPGNYSTIQEAISDADDGDSIFVYSGDYDGPVEINAKQDLTIIGENRDNTRIIGGPNPDFISPFESTYPAVHIKYSENIILNELNFRSEYFPLIIENSKNITIDHSFIGGSLCWVMKVDFIGSSNVTIVDTRFWEEGYSTDLWAHFDSDDIIIENCTFEH